MRSSSIIVALLLGAASAYAQTSAPPTNLDQRQSDGVTSIPVGGVATSTTVVLQANVNGSSSTALYKLRVEVRPTSTAMTGTHTHEASSWVSQGAVSVVTVTGLTPGQTYHWQARTYTN